jgi:hypothetical protein
MSNVENNEIEGQIVERLKNSDDKNDIILDLCEDADVSWPEAESTLERIEAENKTHIVLSQSPLLVAIALTIFVGGVVLVSATIYDLIVSYNMYISESLDSPHIGYLSMLFLSGGWFLERILLGLLMIIGSLRGMQDVWQAIFEKLGIFQN